MKRLGILCFFIIVLAACSSGGIENSSNESADNGNEDEITTISFWKPPHGDDKEVFTELISKFESENPNIKVVHTIVPWDSVDQQYATTFAGSDPPDVVYMPDEWFPRYAHGGAFMDITDKYGEIADGWDENISELGQYKGVQYGVPHIVATQALIYNVDILEASGYSEPPKTLEELKAMAIQMTNESNNVYGFSDEMIGLNGVKLWSPLFETEGVKLLNEDLTESTFNSPKAVEIVEFIKELYESGATVPRNRFTGDQQDEQIIAGNIAMSYGIYDELGTYLRENPELNLYSSFPPSRSGEISQFAAYGFMFVSEEAKHKNEAWEFVKFLTNEENLEYYAQTVSMFSTRNDSSWWEDEPIAIPFAEALNNAPGVIPTVHWREISRIITEEIDFVIANQKTAQEGLDDAETAVNEILDGN